MTIINCQFSIIALIMAAIKEEFAKFIANVEFTHNLQVDPSKKKKVERTRSVRQTWRMPNAKLLLHWLGFVLIHTEHNKHGEAHLGII